LSIADRLELTHVDLDVQGDAHYPTIPSEFHKTASEQQVDEKSGTSFEFATYKK
jgi:dihydrofolate reductase